MMGLGANTGALHLRQDGGRTGLIYFDGGALVSAAELDTEALTLGHVLQQLGLASAPQLEHAFQQQTQDPLGKRIGERLVDLQIISLEQLQQALKAQTLWPALELASGAGAAMSSPPTSDWLTAQPIYASKQPAPLWKCCATSMSGRASSPICPTACALTLPWPSSPHSAIP